MVDENGNKIDIKGGHQLIEVNRDKDYEFDARKEELVLLPDTEKVLSVIYTDYLATDEERKLIKAKENRSVHKNNNTNLEYEESKVEPTKIMVEYNDGIWNKIVNK